MAERRFNWLLLLPPLIFLGLGAAFLLGLNRGNPGELPSSLIGQQAPALPTAPLGDHPLPPEAPFADADVTLVNFWASWCGPCRFEHPMLTKLSEDGIPIIGVNNKNDPAEAQAFLTSLGNPYSSIAADRNGRVSINWGVYGLPETFVVDKDGTILLRFAGAITPQIYESRFKPVIDAARAD